MMHSAAICSRENVDEIQVPSVWQMAGYDTHPVSYTHLVDQLRDAQ